jgi:integrase
MSLEIRKSSKWWYGVFRISGQRTVINLRVPITGKRPPKRTMLGDDEFERSRGRAQQAYDKQFEQIESDRTGQKAVAKLAEMKTGKVVAFPALAELPLNWDTIPRRKPPSERYRNQCRLTLERFAKYVFEHQKGAVEFVAVTPKTAKDFMTAEEARGISPKTWNDTLKLLRTTFKHLHPSLNDGSNPFHGLITKATETINRIPFTVEQLKAITETCADDDMIRPIIITGMCTAMRRGDCCLLKWSDVDLNAGFLTVKTAKTGQTVDIPIFPMLRVELNKAMTTTSGKGYCFPEAALMYQSNSDGITWRVKKVLAQALEGQSLQVERKTGKRKASVHDFHSFRVTWITLALASGVPLELVQRVTGHRTVEVVMKHYFKPGREDFRQALLKNMPQMMSEKAGGSVKELMREIVGKITFQSLELDKRKLLELIDMI